MQPVVILVSHLVPTVSKYAYVGVNYSHVTDGLANGFVGTTSNGTTGSETQTTVMVGYRLRL